MHDVEQADYSLSQFQGLSDSIMIQKLQGIFSITCCFTKAHQLQQRPGCKKVMQSFMFHRFSLNICQIFNEIPPFRWDSFMTNMWFPVLELLSGKQYQCVCGVPTFSVMLTHPADTETLNDRCPKMEVVPMFPDHQLDVLYRRPSNVKWCHYYHQLAYSAVLLKFMYSVHSASLYTPIWWD